jgi:hypothetical protein
MDANPSSISDIFDGVLDGVVDLNGAVAINLHDNIIYFPRLRWIWWSLVSLSRSIDLTVVGIFEQP